jgi:hypothetical protein
MPGVVGAARELGQYVRADVSRAVHEGGQDVDEQHRTRKVADRRMVTARLVVTAP